MVTVSVSWWDLVVHNDSLVVILTHLKHISQLHLHPQLWCSLCGQRQTASKTPPRVWRIQSYGWKRKCWKLRNSQLAMVESGYWWLISIMKVQGIANWSHCWALSQAGTSISFLKNYQHGFLKNCRLHPSIAPNMFALSNIGHDLLADVTIWLIDYTNLKTSVLVKQIS